MSSITLYGSFTGLPHCMSLCSSSYFLLKKKKPLARIKINPWPTTTSSPRKCDSFGRSLSNPHPHPQNPKVSRDEIKRFRPDSVSEVRWKTSPRIHVLGGSVIKRWKMLGLLMICVCLNHTPDIRGFESSPKMETSSNTPGWARKVESAWCTMVSFSSVTKGWINIVTIYW